MTRRSWHDNTVDMQKGGENREGDRLRKTSIMAASESIVFKDLIPMIVGVIAAGSALAGAVIGFMGIYFAQRMVDLRERRNTRLKKLEEAYEAVYGIERHYRTLDAVTAERIFKMSLEGERTFTILDDLRKLNVAANFYAPELITSVEAFKEQRDKHRSVFQKIFNTDFSQIGEEGKRQYQLELRAEREAIEACCENILNEIENLAASTVGIRHRWWRKWSKF